ncbi:hypothetical protein Srufu_027930 [Streptomyces libani subsp. rufus]|nr:hypothetical protein Srufu_027930 [Streptomyces libani subsp. rufus]
MAEFETWTDAVHCAEAALCGDQFAYERLLSHALPRVPDRLGMSGAAAAERGVYLCSLLEALGLRQAAQSVLAVVLRALHTDDSVPAVEREVVLCRIVARHVELGYTDEAFELVKDAYARPGFALDHVRARRLANYAALLLQKAYRSGPADMTPFEIAAAARSMAATAGAGNQETLETELLSLSVQIEATRRGEGSADSSAFERFAAEVERVCRRLVPLLGGSHPRSLMALVTLASAEFEAARVARDIGRMEKAVEVLAVAAQRAAATLGQTHPHARAALARLACAEFDTAQLAGDTDRRRRATDLVRAAADRQARRPDVRQRPASSPAPSMTVSRAPQGHQAEPADLRGTEGLRFTVLGPVRAWRGAMPLAAGSPQQRALLAALLLRGGRSATATELVEALWGDEPPHAALAALRTYASRIRKALGEDAEALVSESGGYAIRPVSGKPIDLDLARAEEYCAAAERARREGNGLYARKLITDALELWDGEPLAGLAGPYAERQRTRLQEWRLSLLETRLALELEAGRHAEAVSELTALTSAHPLREELRRLLMLALYRSGRQAEALAVYADVRRLLNDELGVDPSVPLAELQQQILAGITALDGRPPVDEGVPVGQVAVRPHQIPATVSDFTGREPIVRQLVQQLVARDDGGMTIASVAGIGGVGKTTLAVHVALRVRGDFPDGQLYADLQGAGQSPADPEAVLGAFLRALGTPDALIPDGVAERAAHFRSVLNGRRILILLDNARDAVQVRPLLPGNEGCAALITSRTRMLDLAGAQLFDLDVMGPDEALSLFTRIVGAERVQPERQAAMDVVGACGFLPAAIRIAASRLAARRTWTVSVLASKLADERRRLDELRAGDLAVKASFELGYSQLEPRQAHAFRLLGLADGPDISLPAAAAVIGTDINDAEDLFESLVDASLLESAAPGRYRFHDLVRLYARSCAERDAATPDERDEALARLLDFYLATAAEMHALEGNRLVDHVVQPIHQVGLDFEDFAAAQTWLHTEARSLLSCAQQAAKGPRLRSTADLLLLTRDLSDPRANAAEYEQVCVTVLNAAHESGERTAEARAHVALSHAYVGTGRLDEADGHALKAVNLAAQTHDPAASTYAACNRGLIALIRQRYDDAERLLRQALTSAVTDRDELTEAATCLNLSQLSRETERTDQAIQLAEAAVSIYRRLGATRRLGNGVYALGLVYAQADRLDDATAQLTEALGIFQESHQRFWEGQAHVRLAETHLRARRGDTAANHAEQALVALRESGGDGHRATALKVLAKALNQIGQTRRARVCSEEALHISTSLGAQDRERVARLLGTPELSLLERRTS